jgi:uncharacterized protein (UPF0276 family)
MRANPPTRAFGSPVPALAGIGLRSAHVTEFLAGTPSVPWLEVHSENYFAAGGAARESLTRIRESYLLSLHGVGLSLGSVDRLDRAHLQKLADLVRCYQPALVSEHLSWSSVGGRFVNDLLPLPTTREALEHMVLRVDEVQEFMGRQILLENVSSYLRLGDSEMPEHCFLTELAQRTGCGVLLDINNLYVNQCNHGTSAIAFIRGLPQRVVGEIHLAGHAVHEYDGERVVVDTHDTHVCDDVWSLYELAVARFGRVPTLIEWDSALPALEVLINEARRADCVLEEVSHAIAA